MSYHREIGVPMIIGALFIIAKKPRRVSRWIDSEHAQNIQNEIVPSCKEKS